MNVLSTQTPANAPVFIWGLDTSHGETAVNFFNEVKALTDKDFSLAVFDVTDWNDQFSPWPAPVVFGKEAFGGKGSDTLCFLENKLLPEIKSRFLESEVFLTGYSLAGLFSCGLYMNRISSMGLYAVLHLCGLINGMNMYQHIE